MVTNYKGKLARLTWNSGEQEIFGAILDHTEVFIFECRWGEWYALDHTNPPSDLVLEVSSGETVAVVHTDLLGRRGALLLLAAPAQVRLERLDDQAWRQCDLPCKLSTMTMTPIVSDGRCVKLSPDGLLQFGGESLEPKTQVLAEIPLSRVDRLILPGRVDAVKAVGQLNHKMLVRFGELDRLTVGRLRSLTLSLT